MACSSCKGSKTSTEIKTSYNARVKAHNYFLKFIVFCIMMLLMPVIVLALIWILFKNIVLSEHVDIIPAIRQFVSYVGQKKKKDEDEEDDEQELDGDDLELMNVERINDNS